MLKVAFYYWRAPKDQKELFDLLMNKAAVAVRKHMPFADVWHLRAPNNPKYPGAEGDIVLNSFRRPEHHSMMPEGKTLFLDIDCLVRADVFDVFSDDFDIAAYQRVDGSYNGGVVFSRSRRFWIDFARFHKDRGALWHDPIFTEFIKEYGSGFKIKPLSDDYNYTPHSHDEDLSGKLIVHYKGEKKKYWMKHAAA